MPLSESEKYSRCILEETRSNSTWHITSSTTPNCESESHFYAMMDCYCEKTWSNTPQCKIRYCHQCAQIRCGGLLKQARREVR
uniref:Uncharacterized protein n=1 Tax=Nelumbo nucifera TaxID=4432 RepID=A0A822Z4Q1_NELNU|nr:TPA_asm: hypothetical protein HUJ06_012983 [Nelumbo nucifera]